MYARIINKSKNSFSFTIHRYIWDIGREFPLIRKSEIFSNGLTVIGKDLTIYSKAENSKDSSRIENYAQIRLARRDESGISDGS